MRSPSTFEDILDRCLVAIQEQGKTVEECLACYPAEREALEPLLHLALRLESGRTLKAPPELRRTAAARMRNLIATRPRPPERPSPHHTPSIPCGRPCARPPRHGGACARLPP